MIHELEPRPIHHEAVDAALKKAEQYRLLNDPEQAESICLDVLAIEPANERALITIILSITDQFAESGGSGTVRRARQYLDMLTDEYQLVYYAGLICEREARGFLARGLAGEFAYGSFYDAIEYYEKADEMSPATDDEAILRWNSCVRTVRARRLRPPTQSVELPLE